MHVRKDRGKEQQEVEELLCWILSSPDPPHSKSLPNVLRIVVAYQELENPSDGGSHLSHLPSVPLTCSTVGQQEEQGEEQVEDPHG